MKERCRHLAVERLANPDPGEKPWWCSACEREFSEDPHDRFFTGEELAQRVVQWAGIEPGMRVIEPSAGDGALAGWVPRGAELTCVELVPEHADRLARDIPHATIVTGDFLRFPSPPQPFDLALMNPPYSSQPGADGMHVIKALRVATRAVALVRTNFLHGFQRYHQVFRWSRLTRLVILSRRPPFEGPADAGHGARHDYQLIELVRAPERQPGQVDPVGVEIWTI